MAAPAGRIPASTPKRRLANGRLAVGGKAGLPNEARLPTKGQGLKAASAAEHAVWALLGC